MKIIISRNELTQLLICEFTNNEIALKFNTSLSSVKRHKVLYNLNNKYITKKHHDEYLRLMSLGYNNPKIAQLMNCSTEMVSIYHRKFKLKSNFKYNYIKGLNKFETACLIGTLLGDAWLTKSSINSYKGGFTHKESNKDYVIYKKRLLSNLCIDKIYYKEIDSSLGMNQWSANFKASPYLKSIHEKLYINGKKEITNFVLENFSDVSLALYYQDDGSKVKNRGKWQSYRIAMYSFNTSDKERLCKLLKTKWNITAYVTQTVINIAAKDKHKFKYLIKPYVVPSMKYKL